MCGVNNAISIKMNSINNITKPPKYQFPYLNSAFIKSPKLLISYSANILHLVIFIYLGLYIKRFS